MLRRNFLALALTVASTCGLHADQKVWRIAYLHPGFLNNPSDIALLDSFKKELVSLGYEEGSNLLLFARGAEGNNARLFELAEQLVALHPDVIVAVATPAIAAAQRATRSIPIVMTPATDPVGSGFVKTLAEPGTNITGLANMFGDLTEKSVELLHTILPAAKRVAILMSTNPTHPDIYTATQVAAQRFGLLTVPIIARTADDLDEAFQAIRSSRCDAVLVLADPIRPRIVTYATSASTVQISPQYGVGRLDM
jgi:ABC-type uncharacterized transport system substrate-binding protein